MSNERTLTVVYCTAGPVDREAETYRHLLAARLKLGEQFEVVEFSGELTSTDALQFTRESESTYVMFVDERHHMPTATLVALLAYLKPRTVYLAEPSIVTTALGPRVVAPERDARYSHIRQTDLYGVAYHRERLIDVLEIAGAIDRRTVYLNYRLYWAIAKVTPVDALYSYASDETAVVGFTLATDVERLFVAVDTNSMELRLGMLRLFVLFVRGLLTAGSTDITLRELRSVLRRIDAAALFSHTDKRDQIEVGLLRWLATSDSDHLVVKTLGSCDVALRYSFQRGDIDPLYTLHLGGDQVHIYREYVPADEGRFHDPGVLDHYAQPITPDSTLLLFDRGNKADDNAEYFYRYLREAHPEFTKVFFALSPRCADWARLEADGFNLVPMWTPEFNQIFLDSDVVISSQMYDISRHGKSFVNSRFVYLQHGVQFNDMTTWVASKAFDVFVVTGAVEEAYMARIAPKETLNCGIPRLEGLARNPETSGDIVFMPTWRFGLHQASASTFMRSDYYQAIEGLLTNTRLLAYLEENDRTLQVKLHPNCLPRASLFSTSRRIVLTEASYRDLFRSAELLVTDYSSVIADAAFIGAPVCYYQWDEATFFDSQPYGPRVNYRAEGLGPVFSGEDDVVSYIAEERYLTDVEQYRERRDAFFRGVDPHRINDRIFERMMSL